MKTNYTEQDLSFRLAEKLENVLNITYQGDDKPIYAYEIESVLSSCLEDIGLRLRISNPEKFESDKTILNL